MSAICGLWVKYVRVAREFLDHCKMTWYKTFSFRTNRQATLHVSSNWHPFFVDLSHEKEADFTYKFPITHLRFVKWYDLLQESCRSGTVCIWLPDHFCKSKPIFFVRDLACLCLYDDINVCIFQNVKFISASTNINE